MSGKIKDKYYVSKSGIRTNILAATSFSVDISINFNSL